MKYKVGDKVTIRKDLKEEKEYGGEYFISDMSQYKGKTTQIIEVNGKGRYSVKIDNKDYYWTNEMFEEKPKTIKRTIEHIISDNKAIVIIHNEDGRYLKGISKCHPEDNFDEQEGFKRAYNRALGIKNDKSPKGFDLSKASFNKRPIKVQLIPLNTIKNVFANVKIDENKMIKDACSTIETSEDKQTTDKQNDLYQCSDEALIAELESRFIYNTTILKFENSTLKKELEQRHNM